MNDFTIRQTASGWDVVAQEPSPKVKPISERCDLVSCGIVCLTGGRSRILYRCKTCKRDGAFGAGVPPQCLDKGEPA